MGKFTITIESYDSIAKEILRGWQYKLYLMKVRSFLSIIGGRLKAFREINEKNKKTFIIENKSMIELKKEQKNLEDFLFMDEKKINDEKYKEYEALVKDRWIQKLNRKAHKMGHKMKNKAFKAALGGNNIHSFFMRIGIAINWKITK